MSTLLHQYPKAALAEILKQQHRKSFIKNLYGSVNVESFIATMALIKETDGEFVQRAEMIYKCEDGFYKPMYVLGIHEESLDFKGYSELLGIGKQIKLGGSESQKSDLKAI